MTSETRTGPSAPNGQRDESKGHEQQLVTARRIPGILILAGLLLILVWLGLKSWRVYQAATSLLAVETEARALLEDGAANVDPDAAESLVLGAREDIVTLRDELGFLGPVAPYFGWLPEVGPLILAGPHLLAMADAGSEAAALAVPSLTPAIKIIQRDDFGLDQAGELLPVIADARANLVSAGVALERYEIARMGLDAAVSPDYLPQRVQGLLAVSDQWLPLAKDGLRIAPHLPALLGQDGARSYLILAQNEDELRPTGGFLTGVGVLVVENGQIVELEFRDAYKVDNWAAKPYSFPPQPLYDFMRLELFVFRDSNFWPDFPVSAQKAMDLFAYGLDTPPLDGAIAIDQEFLRLLVEATGPVPVPGTDQVINANNLIQGLRDARDIHEGQNVWEWIQNRKAFLDGFAAAVLAKFETDFSSVKPVKLAQNLASAAESRHLSIYVRDPDLADALAANGWDGSLPAAPPGDFWMAVDTNMGYNKVNVLVERSLDYQVTLGTRPEATLSIDYIHTGPPSEEPCYQGVEEEFDEAADYLALADQCYWNYLRVYAPQGSVLSDSSRHVVPGETLFSGITWDSSGQETDELPWLSTFSNFLLLPRGGSTSAYFTYELPADVQQAAGEDTIYNLAIHKQPGTRAEPLKVTVNLPEGASVLDISPSSVTVDGNRLIFDIMMDSDIYISIRYR